MDVKENIEALNVRVKFLEENIDKLQRQVACLQKEKGVEAKIEDVAPKANAWAEKMPLQPGPVPSEELAEVVVQPVAAEGEIRERVVRETSKDSTAGEESKVKGAKGYEGTIGKNLMGILASVLVFVSIVLFGGMIHQHLTPMAKTVMMLVGCGAVAGVGVTKMRGDGKYKTLFTSLAACGLGGLYVSCLVAYFKLETFSVEAVFGSVVAWIAGLVVLSRRGHRIFSIICYCGIIVATFLAAAQWSSAFVALIVYGVSIIGLHAVVSKGNYNSDWLLLLQYPAVFVALIAFFKESSTLYYHSCDELVPLPVLALTFMLVPMAIMAYQVMRYEIQPKMMGRMVCNVILTAVAANWGCYLSQDYKELVAWTFLIVSSAMSALAYVKYRRTMPAVFFTMFYILLYSTTIKSYGAFYEDNLLYFIPAAIVMYFGCRCDDMALRITAYVLMLMVPGDIIDLFSFRETTQYSFSDFAVLPFVAVAAAWVMSHYHMVDKIWISVLTVVEIIYLCLGCDIIDGATCFILLGILSLLFNSQRFRVSPTTGEMEENTQWIAYLYNAALMLVGSLVLHIFEGDQYIVGTIENTNAVMICLTAMMLMALAMVNVKNICANKSFDPKVSVIYTCLKLTVVVWVILSRITSVSYIVSIVGIVMAVAFIVVGFRLAVKPCRLYGLVLSMVCVLKLLLTDLDFGSGILRPVSYLVAGLLCFAISWIYSRIKTE